MIYYCALSTFIMDGIYFAYKLYFDTKLKSMGLLRGLFPSETTKSICSTCRQGSLEVSDNWLFETIGFSKLRF